MSQWSFLKNEFIDSYKIWSRSGLLKHKLDHISWLPIFQCLPSGSEWNSNSFPWLCQPSNTPVPPPSPSPAPASLASSRTCHAHSLEGFCTSCFCCLGTAKSSFFSTSCPSSGATHVHPNLHHFCLVLFSWRDITFLGLAGLSKAHSQCLAYKPQGLTLALMNHASHMWYSQFWSISKTRVFPLSPDGTIS